MKIRLTKKFVIKALKAEVLPTAGDWCDGGNTKTVAQIKNSSTCTRCAVGAVVMQVLTPSATGADVDKAARWAADCTAGESHPDYYARAAEMVEEAPFAALSYFFESAAFALGRHFGVPTRQKMLAQTLEFVEENFPDTVVLDTDGVDKVYKKFPRVKEKKRVSK